MKNNLKNINWVKLGYGSLLLLSIFGINFLTLNNSILNNLGQSGKSFLNHLSFMPIVFVVSLAVIAFDLVRNISWKFVGKLSLGYVIYLIVAYFLLITRNLNNEKFELWDLEGNGFWQVDFLPILIPLVISAFLIKVLFDYLKPKRLRIELLKDCSTSNLLLAGLLASVAVNDGHYINILREGFVYDVSTGQFDAYLYHFITASALSLIGLVLVSYTGLKAAKELTRNQPTWSLIFSASALLAVIFNYTLQLGVKENGAILNKFIFPGATLYQICFLIVIYLLAYFIINRFMITTFIIVTSGIIISVVNAVKQDLRSEPLLITDFIWLQQPELLLKFVNISTVIMTFILIVGISCLLFFLRNKILPGPIIKKKRVRLSLISALVCLSLSVFLIFRNENENKVLEGIPIISKINNWNNINWMGFSTNARYKSLMYVWSKQVAKSIMDTPEGYSESKILALAKKYQIRADAINKTRSRSISKQTVIYVLSESFADPSRISNVNLSQELIPNINQIKNSTTSGLIVSNGYGGGTANMEFQTLTGLPFTNFSSSVSTLYTEVVPGMQLFPSISDQFLSKNRIAIHPSDAANYGRGLVYRKLHFDKFITSKNGTETLKNVKKEGIYPSDETTYKNVLAQINSKESQFFSVITMQNHVPWSSGEPSQVVATGKGFTKKANDDLTSYSRLLTYTDTSTEQFLTQLSKINKDITVVFYGDHLPGLYPDSAFEDSSDLKYRTDYFIWSNFKTTKLNYPLVSSSDFSAELFAHTNSKVSPYYALLTDVLNNATVDKKKLTSSQKVIADDLKLIQYDMTVGKGYIKKNKSFFKTP
ncbi:LTA synthase family protein [Streptococcus caviae]|uniref:LTA synthase family protein n=1 Tax=Streptococcus sp. 'caviae' TaxID=1915004 RepID=UPI00094B818A|nr:LTA synthase family protein [Streptococcus sp. 'caviae']OLN83812.1 phosphoglycerol transferase [Streptococcus sp. 'caviae']